LNGNYTTRYKREHLDEACNTILDRIPEDAASLTLFSLSDEEVSTVANVVLSTLSAIHELGQKRPFSLTTKCLHFLFPDLFVIYDAQAAWSVSMWSLFAIGDEQSESQPFRVSLLSDTSGGGYPAMLQFYRTLWQCSSDTDRKAAGQAAESLQNVLRSQERNELARVTVLDLIDKHLWTGAGNPIRLGLSTVPQRDSNGTDG